VINDNDNSQNEQPQQPHAALGNNKFFIAVDGDAIGARVGQAVLHDNIEELQNVSHSINAGQNILIDFVEQLGGTVISAGGDEMVAGFPQEVGQQELETMRQQYFDTVGATLTVGVGALPSEAGKALIFGKLHGKDQIAPYGPEVESFLYQTHQNPESEEAQKQDDHYLSALDFHGQYQENDGPTPEFGDFEKENYLDDVPDLDEEQQNEHQLPEGFVHHEDDEESYEDPWVDPEDRDLSREDAAEAVEQAAMQENQGEEYQADKDEVENPDDRPAFEAMKDEFSHPIDEDQQEMPPEMMAPEGQESDSALSLKDSLGQVLESFMADKDQLEQLQTQDSELYREVLLLLQQMIVVARKLKDPTGNPDAEPEQMLDHNPHIQYQDPSQMGKL
jgi:hypothetical protein